MNWLLRHEKGVSLDLVFPLTDADGQPITGAANLDTEKSQDGSGFSDCDNEMVEIGTTAFYAVTISSAEMDFGVVIIKLKTSTSGIMPLSYEIHTFENIADNVWDEVLTGLTHNDPSSAGRRLRQLEDATILADGNAQAGSNNTITLESGESSIDGWFDHTMLVITNGPGIGQAHLIESYAGGSKIATMAHDWHTNPDTDSDYVIYGNAEVVVHELTDEALAQVNVEVDTALVDIKLDHLIAVADADDVVDNSIIAKMASKNATADWSTFVNIDDSLEAIADSESTPPTVEAIADAIWDEAKSEHVVVGSFGEEVQDHALTTDVTSLNNLSAAEVNDEVDTALADYDGPTDTEMNTAHALLGTLTEQAKIPKSDGAVSWNSTALTAIKSEADTALANYDAPTKTEMDTAHALLATLAEQAKVPKSDGAIVWNATAQTTIQTKAAAALASYDGPTKSEMDTAHALLSTVDALATHDGKLDTVNGIVDTILIDTNELQGDWANDGRLDLILDSVASGGVAASEIADAVWDESKSGHTGDLKTIADRIDQGIAATELSIRGADSDTLETLSDQLDAVGGGAGTTAEVITINDGSDPIDGATVWATTDSGGSNIVASGTTDALGQVTFQLDAGTYYIWAQKAGYNITNPTTVVVS